MDTVTLPRSFDDTTPAQMMRSYSRRKSSPSHSPILSDSAQPRSYNSIQNRQPPSETNRDVQDTRRPEHAEDETSSEEVNRKPWIGKKIWDAVQQWERDHLELVLENKQSVARDHLANERTYLAWLRTSLSFASIGVAITQLFRLSTTIQPGQPPRGFAELRRLGRPLGATFIGIAVLVLALGVHRYFMSQYWMTKGKFPASRGAVIITSAIAASVTFAAFIIVIILNPDLQT